MIRANPPGEFATKSNQSIRVDDQLWAEVKADCAKTATKPKEKLIDFIEEAFKRELARRRRARKAKAPKKTKPT